MRTRPRPHAPRAALTRRRGRARQRGQAMVEFAIVLTPLMLLLMGIVQLGLVFNGYVSLANATREGARAGSIYVYDRTKSKAQNDAARLDTIRTTLTQGLGLLKSTAPQLVPTEQTVSYSLPAGVNDTDTRAGQYVKVHTHYRMDLLVPLVADLMSLQDGRLPIDAEVTMVIN